MVNEGNDARTVTPGTDTGTRPTVFWAFVHAASPPVLSPTHIHTQRVPIPHESAALGCAHIYTRDVGGSLTGPGGDPIRAFHTGEPSGGFLSLKYEIWRGGATKRAQRQRKTWQNSTTTSPPAIPICDMGEVGCKLADSQKIKATNEETPPAHSPSSHHFSLEGLPPSNMAKSTSKKVRPRRPRRPATRRGRKHV